MNLSIVVEGETDVPVCRRLAIEAGFSDLRIMTQGAKQELDKRLKKFNAAAIHSPWLVLRDLDRDASCAPSWRRSSRISPSSWLSLRVAVRQMEAWLLADPSIADFIGVPRARIPLRPDDLDDAKLTLVNLGRRSRLRTIREGLVPAAGTTSRVGPLYHSLVTEFVLVHWDPAQAARRSDSLRRARESLRDLAARWRAANRSTRS